MTVSVLTVETVMECCNACMCNDNVQLCVIVLCTVKMIALVITVVINVG